MVIMGLQCPEFVQVATIPADMTSSDLIALKSHAWGTGIFSRAAQDPDTILVHCSLSSFLGVLLVSKATFPLYLRHADALHPLSLPHYRNTSF